MEFKTEAPTRMFQLKCQSKDRFIFILMKTRHLIHILEFREVTGDSNAMLPFIFPDGLSPNTESEIKCLEQGGTPLIEKVAAGRHYVW